MSANQFYSQVAKKLQSDSKDQREGLGYCRSCQHEYRNVEVSKVGKGALYAHGYKEFCPQCGGLDDRIFYSCQVHTDEIIHSPEDCRNR